ncbi:MAG: LysR family transcriptional regulator [Anaerolineae bacterium]|nr:LysR family transcriptional regulator [Anaerolineae bacterium]
MDLTHLRTFLFVLERGSLTAAAQELGVSQPAVSKRIQQLERELGQRLLVRGRGGVQPTAAGRLVAEAARAMLAEEDRLRRRLEALEGADLQGTFVLGASTIPGEYLAPAFLAALRQRHPRLQVRLQVADTATVVEWVAAGRVALGLVGARMRSRQDLGWEPFARDEIVLAVPADHPLAAKATVRPQDLEGVPIIQREEGSGTRQMVEETLAQQGVSLPSGPPVLVLGSTQAVLQAVAQGLGVGFVSVRALRSLEGRGAPKAVRLQGVRLERPLWAVYRRDRAEDPAVRGVLAFVREWAAAHADA